MPKTNPHLKEFIVIHQKAGDLLPSEKVFEATSLEDARRQAEEKGLSVTSVMAYYRATLRQAIGEEPILFDCQAESEEHALEQTLNAYPGCQVLGIKDEALFVIWSEGEESEAGKVADGFWNQDEGWSHFESATRYSGFERDEHPRPLLVQQNAQWWAYELAEKAFKASAGAKLRLRAVIEVDYDPEGMSAEALQELLHDNLQTAIGNGALTGNTPAMVDQYSLKVTRATDDEEGYSPRVIIEVDGGIVHQVHHNIEGLDYDVLDFDTEGSDDPDAQEERNQELEAEAESLPFSD